MTKDVDKLKYNDSCIKLFEFIKMLYNGNVPFKTVIEHFSDGNYDGTSNTHVTLNKYLNAMKIFGIKVKKQKGMYSILTPLCDIDFTAEDIRSMSLLKKAENILTDNKDKQNFEDFIRSVELRYNENSKDMAKVIVSNRIFNFDFTHSDTTEQMKLCEQYCQDKQKLEVIYINNYGTERNVICSPLEVTFVKKMLSLRALGNNGSRIYEIPFESIRSIRQLPAKVTGSSIPTTVVYKISGRLALNYKLRAWEKLDSVEDDGSKIIVNKEEDFDLLLRRLMKYGTSCELISPKFLREEMIELINKTLSKY